MSLQLFTAPERVKLLPDNIQRARQFADRVVDTVNYSRSNQTNIEKIRFDHFVSKVGEEAVVSAFRKCAAQVTGPDYQIYTGKRKNWDADLTVNSVGLAVKTQTKSLAERFGLSWTFQADPHERWDPILDDPNAWVCFVICNDLNSAYDCIVYPAMQIQQLKFDEPKLPKLRGKKKVVYAAQNGLI